MKILKVNSRKRNREKTQTLLTFVGFSFVLLEAIKRNSLRQHTIFAKRKKKLQTFNKYQSTNKSQNLFA